MPLVANERLKLTATFLNGLAVAAVAAEGIGPLAALTYGISGAAAGRTVALVGVAWLTGGVVLHLLARALLGRLRE